MSITYHVFGDESLRGDSVFCGLVCVPVVRLENVEGILGDIKEAFGAARSTRIHCREIFHKDARRKSAWSHLSDRAALDLALAVTSRLAGLGIRTCIGQAQRPPVGQNIDGVGSIAGMTITDSKQLIPFAYLAAAAPLMWDPKFSARCKLWIEPSGDFIQWFGGQKRSLERLIQGNYLDEHTGEILERLVPENVISRERPPLLDLADLLTYSSSRAISDAPHGKNRLSDRVIFSIYKSMNPNVGTMHLLKKSA
jgi:hypothetical protein